MLTAEEEKFVKYWSENRVAHSGFMSKLLRGLPMAMIFGLPILLLIIIVYVFSPEWYTKISAALSGTVPVILAAVTVAVLFYAFTRMHFKWEMNEQLYAELRKKEKRHAAEEK